MYSLVFLCLASFFLSLLFTRMVRSAALRFEWVDEPDDHRKFHAQPVPRLGGIAIFLAIFGSYGLLLLVRLSAGHIVRTGMPFALRLLPAVVVIFCIGLVDDLFQIRPWQKLVGQTAAAVMAWFAGIHVCAVGGFPLSGELSFILTLAWIVGCSNAMNLIDGMDGLATGIGLFATITTFIAALLHHNMELAFATVPLAAALLGFLRYNFSPASIFLGDCGSLTLGFVLGCYGILWSEKSTTVLSMSAPLLVLSVPLIDACLAIARRTLRHQPIFRADHAHIHHKMLDLGMSPRRAVLVLYGLCGLAAGASLLLTTARQQYHGFVIVLVCLITWLGIRQLGYSEFAAAGKLVFSGAFHTMLNAQLALMEFENDLAASPNLQRCSDVLRRAYPQFGFSGIDFKLDGISFRTESVVDWRIRIDFPGRGYINLTRSSGAATWGPAAIMFVDAVRRVYELKLRFEQSDPLESPVALKASSFSGRMILPPAQRRPVVAPQHTEPAPLHSS